MNKKNEKKNKEEFSINYYEKIIQDLQYTNSLINNRNISLEKELELIKNKYNLCKQDLSDINMHISICKETQDKIIKDLKERNNYLEQLYMSKGNKYNNDENSIISKNKEVMDKIHNFIEKMKILFDNEIEKDINEEDYLDIFCNNIIKMNEDLLLCKTELNKKIHEINKLKHEIQNMKLYQNNYNNYNNNFINNIPKDFARVKTPVGNYKNKLKVLNNTRNIQIYPTVEKSNSPKSLRNRIDNNISIPKTPQLNLQTYKDKYNNDISINRSKNKKINIEKKLFNSRSYNSYKTLKETEKDRNYKFLMENLNNNVNPKTNEDIIQNVMEKVRHLESTFNNIPNQNNKI